MTQILHKQLHCLFTSRSCSTVQQRNLDKKWSNHVEVLWLGSEIMRIPVTSSNTDSDREHKWMYSSKNMTSWVGAGWKSNWGSSAMTLFWIEREREIEWSKIVFFSNILVRIKCVHVWFFIHTKVHIHIIYYDMIHVSSLMNPKLPACPPCTRSSGWACHDTRVQPVFTHHPRFPLNLVVCGCLWRRLQQLCTTWGGHGPLWCFF